MLHADIRRELAARIHSLTSDPAQLPAQIRPYQLETLQRLGDWLNDAGGNRRGYIEYATGLGKTVLFASIVRGCSGLRCLIVVPTKVLLVQTARVISRFCGGMLGYLSMVPKVMDDEGNTIALRGHRHCDILLTTDESLILKGREIAQRFSPHVIMFDECHWGQSESVQRALNLCAESVVIGFSATPDFYTTVGNPEYIPVRLENDQLLYLPPNRAGAKYFGTRIDRRTVSWGIESKWLAPLAWSQLPFALSLDSVPVRDGQGGMDYQLTALQNTLDEGWASVVKAVCQLYKTGAYGLPDRQAMSVCPSVRAAEYLAAEVRSIGISAVSITGGTPDSEREAIIARYRSNEVRLLTSVMVLREGWDASNAEICLMLRPTKSRVLYQQCVGRVLRPAENKVALVIDGLFTESVYKPLSAPALFAPVGSQVTPGEILIGSTERVRSPFSLPSAEAQPVPVTPIVTHQAAGTDGLCYADGEWWASCNAIMIKYSLNQSTVLGWIASGRFRTCAAQRSTGQSGNFYAVVDVAKVAGRPFPIPRRRDEVREDAVPSAIHGP